MRIDWAFRRYWVYSYSICDHINIYKIKVVKYNFFHNFAERNLCYAIYFIKNLLNNEFRRNNRREIMGSSL